jgi:phage host-nuclease inhibitor protein Gam
MDYLTVLGLLDRSHFDKMIDVQQNKELDAVLNEVLE